MKIRIVIIMLIALGYSGIHAVSAEWRQQHRARQTTGAVNIMPRVPVLLVNFSDKNFIATNTVAAFDSLFNGDTYTYNNAYGSVKQYFSDQSSGQYEPAFDLYGPITLSQNMAYYGANSNGDDVRAGDMIIEACLAADSLYDIDLSQYDQDKDGYADIVYVIYAGRNEADGGSENTIWPHGGNIQKYINITQTSKYTKEQTFLDGVYIDYYCCNSELVAIGSNTSSTGRLTIGYICHELCRALGLPELYDTQYGTNYEKKMTPDAWDIMDYGAYNGNGNYPPNFSVWEKAYFGWLTPVNLGTTPQALTLHANGTSDYNAYYVNSDGTEQTPTTEGLCYYFENRQKTGWDSYLPGHGLLIWRVDYNEAAWAASTVNNTANSPRLTVVSATGNTENIGSATDPFPGTRNVTSWISLTDRPFTDITESNNIITCVYISQPDTVVEEKDVELSINLPGRQWTFVMFPEEVCDVQMTTGNFELGNNTYWGTYDGALRSTNVSGWVFYSEPRLDCSHAYIVYSSEPTQIMLTLPQSVEEVADITIPVSHFPALNNLNDSWNFIGNPYIYGYDINGLAAEGITTKIAVWDGQKYNFFTPGADNYVLEPLQPFFIQLPQGAKESVTFRSEYVIK